MANTSGVYPCYENQFQINTAASGASAAMKEIADCESFSVSFDNGVEEWTPFDQKGWTRRLMTAKSVTISVTAKRNVGDAGNAGNIPEDEESSYITPVIGFNAENDSTYEREGDDE